MTAETPDRFREQLPPITRSLLGVAKGVSEEDYYRYLEEKYGAGASQESLSAGPADQRPKRR